MLPIVGNRQIIGAVAGAVVALAGFVVMRKKK
jgi:LPXTG-motif cell wall-anchored protein